MSNGTTKASELTIGLDLGDRFSEGRVIDARGEVVEAFRELTSDQGAVEDCKAWLLRQKRTRNWGTTKATADAVYALLSVGEDLLQTV